MRWSRSGREGEYIWCRGGSRALPGKSHLNGTEGTACLEAEQDCRVCVVELSKWD